MMETLPLHIEYLLTRHDCVIVPGFGAFIATESDACFDVEKGVIYPSRREISFNSSVVTDDGLLSHSVARRDHLPYEIAHRRVSRLTDQMKSDLLNEGEVSMGMLGRLVQDSEGLISFQPRKSSFANDLLPDIKLIAVNPARVEEPAAEVEIPETQPQSDDIDTDGMRTIRVAPDRYVFTISKRAVHVAAMLVTIFTVGLSLLIPINHDNEQKASVISIEDFFRQVAKTDKEIANDSSDNLVLEEDSIASVELTVQP